MQLANIPSKILKAFGFDGGKNTIPFDSQIGVTPGAASYTDGFPPLTRTPLSAGGTYPDGLDMNGILYESTNLVNWLNAGGGFPYDATFASDPDVNGYPKGARVMRTDGQGYWLSIADNNTTDPEAGGAGWVPDYVSGAASITMTNANVTLTSLQAGRPIVAITGTLSSNLNLIFPTYVKTWAVINLTSGNFSITAKTSAGTGVTVLQGSVTLIVGNGTDIYSQIQNITQSAVVGSTKNLKTDSLGINNYNCVITADEVILENSSNQYITQRSVSKTINANGTVGAPLSIMSSRTASTWYYRWLWFNSTNGLTATLDTSSTSPTAPTGYVSTDYKCLLSGADRTDSSGSSYLLQLSTRGFETKYIVLAGSNVPNYPIMQSGTTGNISTPTYTAVSVSNYVPPIATNINAGLTINAATGGPGMLAPSNAFGAYNSVTNPAPLIIHSFTNGAGTATIDMQLQSSNIYVVNGTAGCVFCTGFSIKG